MHLPSLRERRELDFAQALATLRQHAEKDRTERALTVKRISRAKCAEAIDLGRCLCQR